MRTETCIPSCFFSWGSLGSKRCQGSRDQGIYRVQLRRLWTAGGSAVAAAVTGLERQSKSFHDVKGHMALDRHRAF